MDISGKAYFFECENLAIGDCLVRYQDPIYGPGWLHFSNPTETHSTSRLGDVKAQLRAIEYAANLGGAAVGFLSYESASAFDINLPPPKETHLPLLWFGIYRTPPKFFRELLPVYETSKALQITHEWDIEQYAQQFVRVKTALGQGEVYQVNLSSRIELQSEETLFTHFRRTCGTQPPPYATFIQGENWQIASYSPELFIRRLDDAVTMIPMKGTRRDAQCNLPEMPTDAKSLAENLMIVDMVRNDLGKIAHVGSVKTPKLFEVESHRTVKQMVSQVEAKTSVSFCDLIEATYPPASVTGAPKVAACHKIFELESSAREIYCGTIGMLQANGDARFAVAIRTAWQTSQDAKVHYGIGGGLVWDSSLEDEFEECLLKSEILNRPAAQWELIECFHRDALHDLALLEDHWLRFQASAVALGVPIDKAIFLNLISSLAVKAAQLPKKIRVAARLDGSLSVTASESVMRSESLRASPALRPVFSRDPNMIHKTNSRQVLDQEMASALGYDEVLLFNERDEVCEFSRGNALFKLDGRWFTPEPACGCLPGIGVSRLVRKKEVEYRRITIAEAKQSEELRFVNSIVGVLPVTMEWPI